MKYEGQLLPEQPQVTLGREDGAAATSGAANIIVTRNHETIRRWAKAHQAEPATGEATSSGPATVAVNDGGAGIRFNFPGTSLFRPIGWEEWLRNFDGHECAFVFENDSDQRPLSNRYRIVKARDWKDLLPEQG
jgi:hypothetical protein